MSNTPNARLARVLRLLADVAERGPLSVDAKGCLRAIYDYEICKLNSAIGHAESYATEAARLAGVPVDGWVLVSDRLPEDDTSVLLTAPGGYVTVGQCGDSHWWLNGAVWPQNWPLAWRPLPEPYRPEEKTDEQR